MLATVLRVFIALEFALYAALAWLYLDVSVAGAGLFALVGILGLRVWITGVTYVYASVHHSPSPRLGLIRAVGMFLAECAAFVVNFVLISPFERWWMGSDRLMPGNGRPPLLLIHGYGCSRAAWWWLRRRLEAAGWIVATINLEPIYTSIETYVEPVSRRIDEVLTETGATQLILVGHSMGGLVARAYLRRHGVAKVIQLVTLGAPHAGSELARIAIGQNARQMTPGNAWLKTLASETPPVDTVTIYSPHDNYVVPQSNLEWPGAKSTLIDGLGHLFMLYSPRVAEALLDGLAPLSRVGTVGIQYYRDNVDSRTAGN